MGKQLKKWQSLFFWAPKSLYADSTEHKETRLLPWFGLSKGAKEQENIRKLLILEKWWTNLTSLITLGLISGIVNSQISDLLCYLVWNIKWKSVQNWAWMWDFFCCCFVFLSYSESFSFQAWGKKFWEKNPMNLLMIWVSTRILI